MSDGLKTLQSQLSKSSKLEINLELNQNCGESDLLMHDHRVFSSKCAIFFLQKNCWEKSFA